MKADKAWIDGGVALEEIPVAPSGACPVVVLIDKEWENIYFAVARDEWTDKDYFEFAEKKMQELDINPKRGMR